MPHGSTLRPVDNQFKTRYPNGGPDSGLMNKVHLIKSHGACDYYIHK